MKYRIHKWMGAAWDSLKQGHVCPVSHAKTRPRQLNKLEKPVLGASKIVSASSSIVWLLSARAAYQNSAWPLCQRVCSVSQVDREDGFLRFWTQHFSQKYLERLLLRFLSARAPWMFLLGGQSFSHFSPSAPSTTLDSVCFLESKRIEIQNAFPTPGMRKLVE